MIGKWNTTPTKGIVHRVPTPDDTGTNFIEVLVCWRRNGGGRRSRRQAGHAKDLNRAHRTLRLPPRTAIPGSGDRVRPELSAAGDCFGPLDLPGTTITQDVHVDCRPVAPHY